MGSSTSSELSLGGLVSHGCVISMKFSGSAATLGQTGSSTFSEPSLEELVPHGCVISMTSSGSAITLGQTCSISRISIMECKGQNDSTFTHFVESSRNI